MGKIKSLLKPDRKYRLKNKRLIFINDFVDYKGQLPEDPSIIRERLKPRLYDYSYIVTAKLRKVIDVFINLTSKKSGHLTILDVGCGYKPFQALFPKNTQYIGVDIDLNSYADIIANNQRLPFKNNSFDAIIASEVLEHCSNEYQLIKELRRVGKNNCLIYISLPFIFPLHGIPHDFNRFTKYKLLALFKKDKIIQLQESNNIFGAIFIFSNIFLRILFGTLKFLYPVFVINNILGLTAENLGQIYRKRKGVIAEYWEYALTAFPMGYSMIVKIKK